MPKYQFQTVDVFTDRRFGGNPLAVFPNATGMSEHEMQCWATEFNLSETTFVLPPENKVNTARVRIFNRTTEMDFAGHPLIGTAHVLSGSGHGAGCEMRLEVRAGLVPVVVETGVCRITAPQLLTLGEEVAPEVVAACVGLNMRDIVVSNHRPVFGSMGNAYVFAEVREEAMGRCVPDLAAFRDAVRDLPPKSRFSIHVYSREANQIHARMFAPLAGTLEDPATGSANAPLAGLLLSLSDDEQSEFTVRQGAEMGRPSFLQVSARRTANGIEGTVAGRCVLASRGETVP